MVEALRFEPTGRKRRTTRLFSAGCTCGTTIKCPEDVEPWGWVNSEEVARFLSGHRVHGRAGVQLKTVERD